MAKNKTHIGRYQLKKKVGEGGMGVVYKAFDPNLAIDVAIKVLRPDMADKKRFIQRFFQEAKVIARLTHPNIIQIYNTDEDQGYFYIAMKFIEGQPLHTYIKETETDLAQIIDITIQIADALDYAHRHKIIHRDIKPSNIIITPEGHVFLTDFGVAHLGDSSIGLKTVAGARMGTPLYMSPEQLDGLKTDGRSDLFSLGIVLYEMVTGTPPFPLYSRSTKPKPPIDINPGISKAFSRLILKSIQTNPDKRFQTGREMAEALNVFANQEKTVLYANKQIDEAPISTESLVAKQSNKPPPPAPGRRLIRPPLIKSVLVSIIILGCAVAAIVSYQSRQFKKPAPAAEAVVKGSLKIESSPPGAAVFIDDSMTGNASQSFELPVGRHDVRLSMDHYFDGYVTVWVAKGETRLHYRLLSMDRTEW